MKCIACNSDGRMHKTQGAGEFGPSCDGHRGMAWALWFGSDDKYLRDIERWLWRRAQAVADGVAFNERAPIGPGEKALDVVLFERGFSKKAEEIQIEVEGLS